MMLRMIFDKDDVPCVCYLAVKIGIFNGYTANEFPKVSLLFVFVFPRF